MGYPVPTNFDQFSPITPGGVGTSPSQFTASTIENLEAVVTTGFCQSESDFNLIKPGDLISINYSVGTEEFGTQIFKVLADGKSLGIFGDGSGTMTSLTFNNGLTSSPNPVTTSGTAGLSPMSSGTLLANITGVTNPASPSTLSAIIDFDLGATQGQLLYRNATTWVALPPGTNGQTLLSGGASANLSWGTPSLPSIGVNQILMNYTAGSAPPTGITLGNAFYQGVGNTQGSLFYCDSSQWLALAPAEFGQVLQCGGAAANPSWVYAVGGNNAPFNVISTNTYTVLGTDAGKWISFNFAGTVTLTLDHTQFTQGVLFVLNAEMATQVDLVAAGGSAITGNTTLYGEDIYLIWLVDTQFITIPWNVSNSAQSLTPTANTLIGYDASANIALFENPNVVTFTHTGISLASTGTTVIGTPSSNFITQRVDIVATSASSPTGAAQATLGTIGAAYNDQMPNQTFTGLAAANTCYPFSRASGVIAPLVTTGTPLVFNVGTAIISGSLIVDVIVTGVYI